MSESYRTIKRLIKVIDESHEAIDNHSKKIETQLVKLGLSKEQVISIANEIGVTLQVTHENADELEWFAGFIKTSLYEYTVSIRIYLEIIKVVPYKYTIYQTIYLHGVYLYDLKACNDFDFISNAVTKLATPLDWLDPIFYCNTYTFIGHLLQRLGRFGEARVAYNMAMAYKDDPRGLCQLAEYGNLELDFVASVSSMNPFQVEQYSLSDNNKPLLIIGSVFFGTEYEYLFRHVAAASFFCKSNIEVLKKNWQPLILIFCTLFDKTNFEQSKLYRSITKYISVQIVTIPDRLIYNFPVPDPIYNATKYETHPRLAYSLSGLIQTCLIILARQVNASLINLPPDAIFSNTVAATIAAGMNGGNKIIFTPGIRLKREVVLNNCLISEKHNYLHNEGLSPSQLTQLGLNNLHPATEVCFATNAQMTHPGLILWPVEKDGLFMHCFHMHPIFVSGDVLRNAPVRRFDSIDGDFVYVLIPNKADWHNIHVVTDPSQIMMFELSGPGVPIDRKFDTQNLALSAGPWIASVMRPLSFWLLTKRIIIGNVNQQNSADLQVKATKTVMDLVELGKAIPINEINDSTNMLNKADADFAQLIRAWDTKDTVPKIGKNVIPSKLNQPVETIRVIYSLAVWGKRYIENFLNICLPSMLSEGNLGDLVNNKNSLFVLYIKTEDIQIFEKNTQFRRLQDLITVQIVELNNDPRYTKYTVLSDTQADTVKRSREFDAICFLYADAVWAKGGIKFALQKLAEGYDGVVTPGPPVVLEDFYVILEQHRDEFITPVNNDGAFNISVSPRTLVKRAKTILHPMIRDNNLDYKINTASAAYVLWSGPEEDLLIRSFHTHPVILRIKHNDPNYWAPFKSTLDEWFLPRVYSATDRLYFVRDSDELTIISLMGADFPTYYIDDNYHLDSVKIAQWAEAHAAPMHKISFNYYMIWHEHDIVPDKWRLVIERSEIMAREVLMRVSMPDLVSCGENPSGYANRITRAKRFGVLSADNGMHTRDQNVAEESRVRFNKFQFIILRIIVDNIPEILKRRIKIYINKVSAKKPGLGLKLLSAYRRGVVKFEPNKVTNQ